MTFLIDLTVDNNSNNLVFALFTKEHTTTKTHAFPNVTKKKGCVLVWLRLYWLKEMLLSPLLDFAINRCAGRSCWEKWCLRRDRENSRKKLPAEQWTCVNVVILYQLPAWVLAFFSKVTGTCLGVFDHGVFSQHTLVLQRLRFAKGNWCAVLPCKGNEMSWKPSHARVRRLR